MIEALITSKTRIRLLVKFFLNPAMSAYLRELSDEFGESTNGIRVELNRMAKAGILETRSEGKTLLYKAKVSHPLFNEISGLVAKYIGLDKIVEDVVRKLGKVDAAYITGDYAKGKDTGIVDLVLVGDVDKAYLLTLIEKVENLINRKIRFLILTREESENILNKPGAILIWRS
ncbi:MAG: winged helix-turn-helix domain-containing protein [Flavobacteriales bacterium]|nr:winged helix-turn-helix domain-containing protein [Flavobacteriales bacterium]